VYSRTGRRGGTLARHVSGNKKKTEYLTNAKEPQEVPWAKVSKREMTEYTLAQNPHFKV